MSFEEKPNFDEGIPSLESTIDAIKAAATREPSWSKGPDESPGEAPGDATGDSVPGMPAVAEKPGEANPGAPEASPAPKEARSAALNRLLEREAAIIEREAKLKAAESQEASPSKAEPSLAQIRALYRRNKIEALKLLDEKFNPGKTAKELWYSDLGDLAPKDARAEIQAETALGSVEALRAEMEEANRAVLQQIEQHKAELAYQQYLGSLQSFTDAVPDSLPLVKKFSAKKPDKVVRALFGVAQKHAQATNGQVLTPAQAAARLEASLKELQLGDVPAEIKEPQPASQAAPVVPNTLRNKHTVVQPSREVDDSLDDTALRERAMKALEQAKRASQ